MKPLELEGQRYGKLTVIKRVENLEGRTQWLCRCDCGKEAVFAGTAIHDGYRRSCGCDKHTYSVSEHNRIKSIWRLMMARCYNPEVGNYRFYGAKGVTVCEEWHDFECFERWAYSSGYKNGLTIDRRDPYGSYCPENCRWATWGEQRNNKRDSIKITYDGKTMTATQWARHLGVRPNAILARIKRGMDPIEALEKEIRTDWGARPVLNEDTGEFFKSASEASRYYGLSESTISKACREGTLCMGCKFRYTDSDLKKE